MVCNCLRAKPHIMERHPRLSHTVFRSLSCNKLQPLFHLSRPLLSLWPEKSHLLVSLRVTEMFADVASETLSQPEFLRCLNHGEAKVPCGG